MTERVLIYNGNGVGPNSSADVKELFVRYGIYNSPDVEFTDFNISFDGLNAEELTIVLPGGAVTQMGMALLPQQDRLQALFSAGAKGLGICAGAYLMCSNAELFFNNYQVAENGEEFIPPTHQLSTQSYPTEYYAGTVSAQANLNLNIFSDCIARGPFIPNGAYLAYAIDKKPLHATIQKPYCVNLRVENDTEGFSIQTFLGGCGFEYIDQSVPPTSEVVATYQDKESYSFSYAAAPSKTIHNMAAILRRQGLFATGTHIETCVEDSKLWKLFQEGKGAYLPLPEAEKEKYNPDNAREVVIPILKDTLNRRPR